jgi:hypothetical protein
MSQSTDAELINRGGGLIYDTVLNVTWLQDANLAETNTFGLSDIDSSGKMHWDKAMAWISAMNNANYKGYSNWRLPKSLPINSLAYIYETRTDGTSDNGYNVSAPGTIYEYSTSHELSFMYYVNLRNKSPYFSDGSFGEPNWGLVNVGLFDNLIAADYWSLTTRSVDYSFSFRLNDGDLNQHPITYLNYAWALRDGDVTATVPIPGAVWLFGSALVGLACLRRRLIPK